MLPSPSTTSWHGDLTVDSPGASARLLAWSRSDPPEVVLDLVHVEATLREGVVALSEAQASGPEATIAAEGQVRLVRPLQRSTLDLTVRLSLAGRLRERLGPLLELAAGPLGADGSVERFDAVADTRLRGVTGLAEDAEGAVWLSSGSHFTGVFRWDERGFTHHGRAEGLHAAAALLREHG